jgi:hypothetical protein
MRYTAARSSRTLAVIAAATIALIGFEISTWVIHDEAGVWVIRFGRISFEVCVATALGFVLRSWDRQNRLSRLNEASGRELAKQQMRLLAFRYIIAAKRSRTMADCRVK